MKEYSNNANFITWHWFNFVYMFFENWVHIANIKVWPIAHTVSLTLSYTHMSNKQVAGRMSAHNFAVTYWFIKKRQVSKTTQNRCISHLFQLKGKVQDWTLFAVLVQHRTQLWLSVLFCWYNLGSRLLEYVSWHFKVHNFLYLYEEGVLCFAALKTYQRDLPRQFWSFNRLIWKALFWILACLLYCRPYSALYLICNWTSRLSAK